MRQQRLISVALSTLLAAGMLGACATQATAPAADASKTAAPAAPAEAKVQNYFLVHHENGRLYPFADAENYLNFMQVDEVIYTRTRVGAGPDGETIVFGIQKKEAEDLARPALAEQLFDGKLEIAGPFYGEVFRNGRYHVFGEWADFKDYLAHKEIVFTFTEVGSGPRGESVIYALNKKTKDQGRPVALIDAFSALRQPKQ